MSFEETILLSIKRKYSKNEEFSFLLDQIKKKDITISELGFRLGELKSELEELKHLLEIANKKQTKNNNQKPWTKDDYVLNLERDLKRKMEKNSDLQQQVNKWRNMYLSLQAGITKQE